MLIVVVGAFLAFAPAAEPAGSSEPAPAVQPAPAKKPKMVEVCTRIPDPGGRVPKRVCKKVEQKEEAEEKAPTTPTAGQ